MTGRRPHRPRHLRIMNCSPSVGGPLRRVPRPPPREARSMPYLQPFSYVVIFCVSFLSMYGVTLHVCLCCEQGAVWPPWPDTGAPKAAPSQYPWGRSGGCPYSVATGTAPPAPGVGSEDCLHRTCSSCVRGHVAGFFPRVSLLRPHALPVSGLSPHVPGTHSSCPSSGPLGHELDRQGPPFSASPSTFLQAHLASL